MIGYGIAQRTILAEPDKVTVSTVVDTDTAVTIIDGAALNAFEGSQTVEVDGVGDVFTGYGRTTDVLAWLGEAEYTILSYDTESGELESTLVRGLETELPNPNGSDLWLDDYLKDDELSLTVNVPDDISFIVAADGVAQAPDAIAISWPLDNSTPWAGPLIAGGAIVLLLGLGLLLWATSKMKSSHGPRRKSPKQPKQPKQAQRKTARKSTQTAASGRRRGMIAVPMVLVGALALSGCSADFWPDLDGAAVAPSAEATEAPEEVQLDPPAVTVRQVERIIARISAIAEVADADRDAELIATRFDGAALELRLANYTIRGADGAVAALPAIPDGPVKLTLPQQTVLWPRTVFAVIQDDKDATIPPLALFLEQADPRSDYKVTYAITLEPSAVLPDVAPASVGASRLATDSSVLKFTPTEVALAYADVLERDVESNAFLDFEAEGDSLRVAVGLDAKKAIRASLPTTASVTFGHLMGEAQEIALATNNAGAIVAVNLYETTTVKPVEAGAAVNPSGQVKALSGVAISTKGVIATYGDQLLFYVPPAGSDEKIVLLGYSQGLVKASEIG
jgi:hypothetical protein